MFSKCIFAAVLPIVVLQLVLSLSIMELLRRRDDLHPLGRNNLRSLLPRAYGVTQEGPVHVRTTSFGQYLNDIRDCPVELEPVIVDDKTYFPTMLRHKANDSSPSPSTSPSVKLYEDRHWDEVVQATLKDHST